jgi:hypothetical protein
MGLRLSSFGWLTAAVALACSQSDDSVLALNLNSAPDVKNVSSIAVTVTRPSGAPLSLTIVPPNADGGPVPTFFQRITLPGWEGALHVRGVASGPDLTQTASDDVDLTVEKGGAVVGNLTLHYPDAGADAGDAGAGDAATDAESSDGGSQDGAAPSSEASILDSAADAPAN